MKKYQEFLSEIASLKKEFFKNIRHDLKDQTDIRDVIVQGNKVLVRYYAKTPVTNQYAKILTSWNIGELNQRFKELYGVDTRLLKNKILEIDPRMIEVLIGV